MGAVKGLKFWNDGKIAKFCSEKPGEDFVLGRLNKPWNKGLTKEDHRVLAYVEKQTGQKRKGNYKPPKHWKGSGNPWFGKERRGEDHPRYKGLIHNREFKNYYNKVRYLTEKNYLLYKEIINPKNLPRSLNGIKDGYQLDHIYPIIKGYENNIDPSIISSVDNLQIITWQENREKWMSICHLI